MLRIRLQRTGRNRNPTFRIVVADKARSAKGSIIESLGHYLPARKEPVFEVREERVLHWIGHGAIPSDTLARLLKRKGMKDMERFAGKYVHRKKKGVEEAATEAKQDNMKSNTAVSASSPESKAMPDEKETKGEMEVKEVATIEKKEPDDSPKKES